MRHRSALAMAAVLLLSGTAALMAGQGSGKARALFNGKDLTGWEGDPKLWSVKDGAITGTTTAENPIPANTFLIWRGGTVKDFELRAKFRLRNHNSGIQYRSKELGPGFSVGGYQADIAEGDQYTGIVYEERARAILAKVGEQTTIGPDGKPKVTGSVGDPAAIRAAIRPGDWNEYVITARGNRIKQAINGKITAEVIDDDPKGRAMEGILALQLHRGPAMQVQFKDIMLTPLGE